MPKGSRFDWDAYYVDSLNGMSYREQQKKVARRGYYTTEQENDLLDIERYESDVKRYGKEFAEKKQYGHYKYIV